MMELEQITPHIYWTSPEMETDRPVLGAVVGEKSTLMVDAGNSPDHAQQFLKLLKQHNLATPEYCVLTHWHWDHVFGAQALNGILIAHAETQQKLQELREWSWRDRPLDQRVEDGSEIAFCRDHIKVELSDRQRAQIKIQIPELSFEKQLTLDLGGLTAHIVHVGGDHSLDSSVVFVPEEKVVFLGDCLCESIYETPRRYTARKIFPLLEKLLSLQAAYYLEGHNSQPMSFGEMESFTSYLKTVSHCVSENKGNPAAATVCLTQALGRALNQEDLELLDNFIHGL